ncbi:DUF2306 domain-containing protein [Lysobacter tyrosinilyticus]
MQAANELVATLELREHTAASHRTTWSTRALRFSAAACFSAMTLGLTAFATYLIGFYGRAAIQGHPEKWNDVLQVGYVPGDTAGNAVLASHLAFGFIVTLAGVLQVLPWVRNRWPRFHRWTGRLFALSAAIASLGGLIMIWTRGAAGDVSQHIAISINALLILTFAGLAWQRARARRFDAHRRWALRLFLVVNGGWFFRIGLMLWLVVNHGPVGFDPKTFTGPFLTGLAFAQYLVPLALLDLYFRAQRSRTQGMRLATAGVLSVVTLAMLGGIAATTAMLWLPRL